MQVLNVRSVKVSDKNMKINQVKYVRQRAMVVVHYDNTVVVYDLKTMDKLDTLNLKKCLFFIFNEGVNKADELMLITK